MSEIRVVMPPLHKAQQEILEDKKRFNVLCAGRRFGKSRLGAALTISEVLQGKRWWWIWPTYSNGLIGWRILERLAVQIPGVTIHKAELAIRSPNGGECYVKSADKPQSLRGEGLDGAIFDEAAHMRNLRRDVWEQAVRPALSDRLGEAWFISTPKGFNDFYELYQVQGSEWQHYRFPTWDNPHIEKSEIDQAKKDLPDLVFRQEYAAEFVQLAGALFRREWFNIIDALPQVSRWVRFWDLATSTKTSADYTVGAKVGLGRDGMLVIADIVRGRWEWPDALKTISRTARSDGAGVTQAIESVGTQKGMYQQLLREPTLTGITIRAVNVTKDKLTRANPWLARAEQEKVVLLRGQWNAAFLDETCAFPEVNHDDQVDAVSGAVQMLGSSGWARGPSQ